MRQTTYEKTQEVAATRNGYVKTRTLKEHGITDRQIAILVAEGVLEKITHGCFWHPGAGGEKPPYYRAIEMNMTNPRAVACAFSAGYLDGLLEEDPEIFYFATLREDRHKMSLPFATRRFYYPELHFEEGIETISTPHGEYRVYNMDRAICDCVRFQKHCPAGTEEMLERYKANENRDEERLERYRLLVLRNRQIL